MGDKALEEAALPEVEPVLRNLGFELVELSVGKSHRTTHATIVVYGRDGVGVDDLALINRALRPGLEHALATQELNVTVSSPGIDRRIKDPREYSIFRGKGVRLRLKDEVEWVGGIIETCDGERLFLMTPEGGREIDLESVLKAKLDSAQEVMN
jgi:ribosome maturation factor RimP